MHIVRVRLVETIGEDFELGHGHGVQKEMSREEMQQSPW